MKNGQGTIASICISDKKGVCKQPVEKARIIKDYGIEGDAHADFNTHRQVSLLALESIEKMKKQGLKVRSGSFAENLAVSGLALSSVKIGYRFKLGEDVILEVTQIGKECHNKCAIFYKAGYCIMPGEGVFAKVIKGGLVKKGNKIRLMSCDMPACCPPKADCAGR
jgi:MOSC domain-containing protein YiiM